MRKIYFLLIVLLFTGGLQGIRAQIPNNDFESWSNVVVNHPTGWPFVLGTCTDVMGDASLGNHAVKIQGIANANYPGVVSSATTTNGNTFKGGQAYTDQPDSLLFDVKYDIPAGIHALVMVRFKKLGVTVYQQMYTWMGTHTSNYETHR